MKAQQIGLVSQIAAEGESLRVARATASQAGKFDQQTAAAAKRFVKPIPYDELKREIDIFCDLYSRPAIRRGAAQVCRERRSAAVSALSSESVICKIAIVGSCPLMSAPTVDRTLDEILNLAAAHFKVPREKLTPDDDFFKTLGIDSLQALNLLTRIEHHFRIELPDYELQGVSDFQNPGDSHSSAALAPISGRAKRRKSSKTPRFLAALTAPSCALPTDSQPSRYVLIHSCFSPYLRVSL